VAAQPQEQRPAAGQPLASRRELVEVRLAEGRGPPWIAACLGEQPAEALASQGRLRRLAAAKGGPQLGVDALVGGGRRARAAEAEAEEGQLEGRALGPVEIEEGVVDVEEDGAKAVQAVTWRGR
jgi:hypothetical protein